MSSLFERMSTSGISIGMGVLSTKGRDKGKVYLVTAVEGRMLKLVDGNYRTLQRVKLKHRNHTKILGQVMSIDEAEALIKADTDTREKNTFIRKAINLFLDGIEIDTKGGI